MRECTHLPCPWPHRCRRQQPHFVPSSTPFLARSGLEALATVRVEEDTGAVPRSATGSVAFGRNGLSSSNGRLTRNRPFAHSDRFPGHKGAGKTGCALHPRSRVQDAHSKNAHEHTGSAEASRPSLRSGFTAYFVLSPVNGSFATVIGRSVASRRFDASTAASGPHDFAVRNSHTRQKWPSRPPHLTARS